MDKFVTINEAAELTGQTPSQIRAHVKKLKQESGQSHLRRDDSGRGIPKWTISVEALKNEFGMSEIVNPDTPSELHPKRIAGFKKQPEGNVERRKTMVQYLKRFFEKATGDTVTLPEIYTGLGISIEDEKKSRSQVIGKLFYMRKYGYIETHREGIKGKNGGWVLKEVKLTQKGRKILGRSIKNIGEENAGTYNNEAFDWDPDQDYKLKVLTDSAKYLEVEGIWELIEVVLNYCLVKAGICSYCLKDFSTCRCEPTEAEYLRYDYDVYQYNNINAGFSDILTRVRNHLIEKGEIDRSSWAHIEEAVRGAIGFNPVDNSTC